MKKKILFFGAILISQSAFSANLVAEKIYPINMPSWVEYKTNEKCSLYDNGDFVIEKNYPHLKTTKTNKIQLDKKKLGSLIADVYKELDPINTVPSPYGAYINIIYKGKKMYMSCEMSNECKHFNEMSTLMHSSCDEWAI
jgi:hypothetical protein